MGDCKSGGAHKLLLFVEMCETNPEMGDESIGEMDGERKMSGDF
jgi:hypothetical protein